MINRAIFKCRNCDNKFEYRPNVFLSTKFCTQICRDDFAKKTFLEIFEPFMKSELKND